MARAAPLATIFDLVSVQPMLQRRRIAARICMGQEVAEIARLEGVTVERASWLVGHPLIRLLSIVWMAFLWRVHDDRDLAYFQELGQRMAEHELETANLPVAVFLCRCWKLVGSPGRGLLQFVAQRFSALALRNMVRRPRRPSYPFLDPKPARPPLTEAQLDWKAKVASMLIQAKKFGMNGGLDLRYLPRNWSRGIQQSVFLKLARVIEVREKLLLADNPKMFVPRLDPGPFPRSRFGKTRITVPEGTSFWRPVEPEAGGYPGAFPVVPWGQVMPATINLHFLYVELDWQPWVEHPPPKARAAPS